MSQDSVLCRSVIFSFVVALQNNSDPGRFIFECFRSHTQTHIYAQPVGFLCMSDQHVAETDTYTTNTTDKHSYPEQDRMQTRDPKNQAAADLSLRSQGHRSRPT